MCGIFGMVGEDITESIIQALIQLQHRGQDAAGLYTFNPSDGCHFLRKNLGLVNQVFPPHKRDFPAATMGIGHVRYSTIGKGSSEDAQPLYAQSRNRIAIAHNGNIVNYVPLRAELETHGSSFTSLCDIEVILHQLLLQLGEPTFDSICTAVRAIYASTHGSYSIVMVIEGVGLLAFRDPMGIRPLVHGVRTADNSHAFSSESGPLQFLQFDTFDDVAPGELILVTNDRQVFRRQLTESSHHHCGFEYVYFAKPNAVLDGHEVYRSRARLGEMLGKRTLELGIGADVVIPIPDTARPSALALARVMDIPIEEGFVKQSYVGRTFIMPTQTTRKRAVSQKLAPVSSVFKGRDVILVDDSIVRGTVSKRVVRLARDAGANKVYFASAYPPIRHPCMYGVDFPEVEQLMAHDRTESEICEELGADGIIYNDVPTFEAALDMDNLCTACLTGKYPTNMDGAEQLQNLREQNLKELELACKP